MLRSIAILIAAFALTSLSAASDGAHTAPIASDNLRIFAHETAARSPEFLASLGLTQPTAAVAQQACCKICSRGKACGNTCIAREKICHVGPGCACDG
jgi:hypothetical protein